jgi:2-C-methyl-D-erythritol 4-phosphate cytidylyltransferase
LKKIAIIVAGGSGERFGSSVPKQFLVIKGKPLLFYTIEKFEGIADEIILVLPDSHIPTWTNLCNSYHTPENIRVVAGGSSRTDSVRNGLELISGIGLVAIHDAVRPFISRNLVKKLFDEARQYGNAIPAIPVNESLRQQNGSVNTSVDRTQFITVQTPQCFDVQIIKKAYQELNRFSATDDATVAELAGQKIHLVQGETTNIKITFPEDLVVAEALLNASFV